MSSLYKYSLALTHSFLLYINSIDFYFIFKLNKILLPSYLYHQTDLYFHIIQCYIHFYFNVSYAFLSNTKDNSFYLITPPNTPTPSHNQPNLSFSFYFHFFIFFIPFFPTKKIIYFTSPPPPPPIFAYSNIHIHLLFFQLSPISILFQLPFFQACERN